MLGGPRLACALGAAIVLALAGPTAAQAATPWCGNDQVATDRVPDAVGGQQIHVVYAIPSDGADRFAAFASAITTDLAAIDAWWRREDPSRAPRFDLFAFPGCAPGLGQLDLSLVRLNQPASAYHASSGRLQRLTIDLAAAGFSNRFKKYLVYYDGVVDSARICGTAFIVGEQGGANAYAVVWMQSAPGLPGCGTVGLEDYAATTAAHELLHSLGALRPGAPHPCPGDLGHACDDPSDIMQPVGRFNTLAEYRLDVNRDDYYAHAGSWLDTQDSAWLQRLDAPDFPLTVAPVRAGAQDAVSSDLPGIQCPTACATVLENGTRVRLDVRLQSAGKRFVGWRGPCTGAGSCELVMDGAKRVEAVFGPSTFRIGVRVVGRGRVTSPGFACARRCSESFSAGGTIRFRARPIRGWRFAGWSGACRGRTPCRVAVSTNRSLLATFRRVQR